MGEVIKILFARNRNIVEDWGPNEVIENFNEMLEILVARAKSASCGVNEVCYVKRNKNILPQEIKTYIEIE